MRRLLWSVALASVLVVSTPALGAPRHPETTRSQHTSASWLSVLDRPVAAFERIWERLGDRLGILRPPAHAKNGSGVDPDGNH